jgi:hypothetical protein
MFGINGPAATVQSLDVDPLSGGPYPPDVQAIIDSDAFANGVQTLLRLQLMALGQLAPPLNVGFLGAIVNAAGTTVTPRIIDGVMALGIDRLAHG